MPDGENGEQQLTSTNPHPITNKSNDDNSNDPDHSLFLNILISTMYYLGEILLVLLLVLSSYASLQKGALKVQLQPPPVSLFKGNSTVRDYYSGDVAKPFSTVLSSDISLVMYYAPWDFDSQVAKHEFEQVALDFQDQVFFTAINCWAHKGACRQTFPKLRTFPLILGYIGGSKGVQYRGPLQYQYMAEFVQHLLMPLTRAESINDIHRLMARNIGVVTGYFNFTTPKPTGFYSFYVAALRYLEYDPYKSIQFATVTNLKAANRLGIRLSHPTFDIRLHLWNETLIYPHNGSAIDVNRFMQWVYYRSHSPIQWIWPSGRKSQVIQHYLVDQERPSLILFTPKLKDPSFALMAKEISLEYNNCVSSPRISRLVREIQIQRERLDTARLAFENQCSVFEKPTFCRSLANSSTHRESCWQGTPKAEYASSINGLGCMTNRSVNFFLMDVDQYPHFLRQLDGSKMTNVAVIVDPKDESHYVLGQSLTRESLELMILNYTESTLRRFRRSVPKSSSPCPIGRICISDISSDEFETVVLNRTQDVMVLYRKKGCVFCDVAARIFLQLSLMLSPSELTKNITHSPNIKLVTIDGEGNDLPWQHSVERYPTIIFYPAYRKMDSRAFPPDVELNVVNLLNFTLSRLSMRKRVTWFIHFCKDAPCLHEAQRRIGSRIAFIDRHVRSLRYRASWLDKDQTSSLTELRTWLKERRFYKELNNAVLSAVSEARRTRRKDLYPEGIAIRLAADN